MDASQKLSLELKDKLDDILKFVTESNYPEHWNNLKSTILEYKDTSLKKDDLINLINEIKSETKLNEGQIELLDDFLNRLEGYASYYERITW